MKKIIPHTLMVLTLVLFVSCKQDKKETKENTTEKTTKTYSVVPESSTINWTAYKTTNKTPVKGSFKTIKITDSKSGQTVKEAIDGLKFSIPVSTIFTNDSIRDGKLQKFFFGVMDNTDLITGQFTVNDTKSDVSITMNGISKTIPIDLKTNDTKAVFTSNIDLNDWNLTPAIESLNKACFDLHKGPDGVSKTWDVAEINAVIDLKVNE